MFLISLHLKLKKHLTQAIISRCNSQFQILSTCSNFLWRFFLVCPIGFGKATTAHHIIKRAKWGIFFRAGIKVARKVKLEFLHYQKMLKNVGYKVFSMINQLSLNSYYFVFCFQMYLQRRLHRPKLRKRIYTVRSQPLRQRRPLPVGRQAYLHLWMFIR